MRDVVFYPESVVLEVYAENHEKRGWVKINYRGLISEKKKEGKERVIDIHKFDRDACLLQSFGFKPITEEAQASTSKIAHPMNQQYGFIAPPKRGDRVLVMRQGRSWIVMGSLPATGGNEPPISHIDDLSFIHRSGSSLRFNDQYPGVTGGDKEFDGITGSTTLVAQRTMVLAGGRFLPFGLLAEHASQTDVKIDINDGKEDGYSYSALFDNSEPTPGTYYDPWADTIGSKKFLSPPDSVPANTLFFLHQGAGLLKMAPLTGATDYTGTKLTAGGFTISVGKKYWAAGLQDKDDCSAEDVATATKDTDPVDGVIRIQNEVGAYVEWTAAGGITIATADGQTFTVTSTGAGDLVVEAPGAGNVLLGGSGASHNVISDNDSTDSIALKDGIFQVPILTTTFAVTHNHGLTAGQSDVKVI